MREVVFICARFLFSYLLSITPLHLDARRNDPWYAKSNSNMGDGAMRCVHLAAAALAAVISTANADNNTYKELEDSGTIPLGTLLSACVPGTDTCFKPAGIVAGGVLLMFIPARALSGGGVRPGQLWSCSINRRGQNVCRNAAPK